MAEERGEEADKTEATYTATVLVRVVTADKKASF